MSSKGYGNGYHPRRQQYRPKYSYDSYESDPESSDNYSSDSSNNDSCKPTKGRSSSARRHHSSDKSNALTAAPRNDRSVGTKAFSDSENRIKRRSRDHHRRSRRYSEDDDDNDSDWRHDSDDSSDDSSSDSKGDMSVSSSNYHARPKSRLEKKVDEILDALGLLHIKHDPSKRQLASPDPEKYAHQKQALQAAVTAAAIEAWRSHSKPGGFNLHKVIRILVAAIAAGGADILIESRPGHDNMRDIAEAVVGGLATSKTLGGKITHRREGGAQGKMIDGFIALAASKMVKPPKPEEVDRRKKNLGKRSRSMGPSKQSSSRSMEVSRSSNSRSLQPSKQLNSRKR
ncbi:hypothetical protein AA313_de0205214 [Arthrobotrys entomopaga]|nr:hypothetical protein AA313_de0205214 [Arthrobotrys entomopaga]